MKNLSYICDVKQKQQVMKAKKNITKEDFKSRVKKAMDLMMYQSVSKNMAIAVCSCNCKDAIEMRKYIDANL